MKPSEILRRAAELVRTEQKHYSCIAIIEAARTAKVADGPASDDLLNSFYAAQRSFRMHRPAVWWDSKLPYKAERIAALLETAALLESENK